MRAQSPPALESRPRRLGKPEREATILDAAAEILNDKGIQGLTMEGLSVRVGVSKPVLYRFFANRDEVLVALYDRESEIFNSRLTKAISGQHTLEKRMRAACRVWIDPTSRHRNALFVLDQPGIGPPELEKRRMARLDRFQLLWADAIRADYDIDTKLARTVATILLGGALSAADTRARLGWSSEEVIETFLTVALAGIERVAQRR